MLIPSKLQPGDEIRVIAPATTLAIISQQCRTLANQRLTDLGLKVTFGTNCAKEEKDLFDSSSVESRVEDIHAAFADKNVKAIITVLGGYNSNQLLPYLDYELIKNNPKILCGYSDITALASAITAKTGLVTYSGLHYSNFGMLYQYEYNLEYFKKCLFSEEPFTIEPSPDWSDDTWYLDQEKRDIRPNEGYWIINPGDAEGETVGANISTFALLQGTPYMPTLANKILFIEQFYYGANSINEYFERQLVSILQQPGAQEIKALLIGRFQKGNNMTQEKLNYIIRTKPELKNIPIIANLDFGHANPIFTFPIGGTAKLENNKLTILKH